MASDLYHSCSYICINNKRDEMFTVVPWSQGFGIRVIKQNRGMQIKKIQTIEFTSLKCEIGSWFEQGYQTEY